MAEISPIRLAAKGHPLLRMSIREREQELSEAVATGVTCVTAELIHPDTRILKIELHLPIIILQEITTAIIPKEVTALIQEVMKTQPEVLAAVVMTAQIRDVLQVHSAREAVL